MGDRRSRTETLIRLNEICVHVTQIYFIQIQIHPLQSGSLKSAVTFDTDLALRSGKQDRDLRLEMHPSYELKNDRKNDAKTETYF